VAARGERMVERAQEKQALERLERERSSILIRLMQKGADAKTERQREACNQMYSLIQKLHTQSEKEQLAVEKCDRHLQALSSGFHDRDSRYSLEIKEAQDLLHEHYENKEVVAKVFRSRAAELQAMQSEFDAAVRDHRWAKHNAEEEEDELRRQLRLVMTENRQLKASLDGEEEQLAKLERQNKVLRMHMGGLEIDVSRSLVTKVEDDPDGLTPVAAQ